MTKDERVGIQAEARAIEAENGRWKVIQDNTRLEADLLSAREELKAVQQQRDAARELFSMSQLTIKELEPALQTAREELATLKAKLDDANIIRAANREAAQKAEAEVARLQPYVRHTTDCKISDCATCDHYERSHLDFADGRCRHVIRPFEPERCTCQKFISKGCTCGLDKPKEV